jgi:transcriptional regulator with XRE-family HTH domain
MGEVERGEKSPSLVVISKIAKGLGISKKDLMDYE